jgi:asparagine synthase (glutamine-hydrolysing)
MMRAVIAAIVNLDGGLADPRELDLFATRAQLPQGGRPRLSMGQGAGLIWIPAHPGVGGQVGSEPGVPPDGGGRPRIRGGCEVVVDGTLDNRMELARELGLPAEVTTPGAEARIVAAAYERWDADCLAHLIGEFALLLWDPAGLRLLAASDAFGMRELYYAVVDRQLRIASQLQMILPHPSLSDLDEEYAADYFVSSVSCRPSTPFKSVRRLQAGHLLIVAAGRLAVRNWWDPNPPALPGDCDEDEVVNRFRTVLAEAVERCLAGRRAWAELSGGLDSSSIVCLAHEILDRDPERAGELATVSYAWKDTPQSDEREFQEPVVEKYGLINHRIWCDDLFFDGAQEESRYRSQPQPGVLFQPVIRAESDLIRAAGVEVLLCGTRAEAVVLEDGIAPVHLADSLRRLRLGLFMRELMRWQRGTHLPVANILLDFVIRPLFGRRRMWSFRHGARVVSPWVDPGFALRMQMRERARAALAPWRFNSIAQQLHYEILVRTEGLATRGSLEWTCEVRHPFIYRPLVELALAIPWEQKHSPRGSKPLLRRAMTGLLPEPVRTRRTRAGPGPAAYKAFAKRWSLIEPVVRSSRLVSMGILDGARLHQAAQLVRFGAAESFADFLSCLSFEVWLRSVTGEG